MADTAAHLVDHVIPHVPVRQWVLSFPYRIRFLLASQRPLLREVRRIVRRRILGFMQRLVKEQGFDRSQSGAVNDRSKEAGFDAHLVKPVDEAVLRRLLAGRVPGNQNQ